MGERMKKKERLWSVLIICAIILVIMAVCVKERVGTDKTFVFSKQLETEVLTVDGEPLTLKDLAFYIAYEELKIEKQAKIYSPEDTNEYWNLHTNGSFVKLEGKQHVIDMAVHDRIFYELALQEQLTLTEEEQSVLEGTQNDFWDDMTQEQQELIAVGEDQLNESMYRIALAEKYQQQLSEQEEIIYDSFDADGTAYKELVLPEHTYEVTEAVWDEVPFGNIIVPHGE
jgi:hypothetical protein